MLIEQTRRCKTCKFWVDDDQAYERNHICGRVPMWWDATEWVEDEISDDTVRRRKPKYADTLAFVQDGSDYKAWLITMPEFGCVMWEVK